MITLHFLLLFFTRFTFYYYFLQDFKGLEFSFISLYSSIQLILLIMS